MNFTLIGVPFPPLLSCREYIEIIDELEDYRNMYAMLASSIEQFHKATGKKIPFAFEDALEYGFDCASHDIALCVYMLIIALWIQNNRPRR